MPTGEPTGNEELPDTDEFIPIEQREADYKRLRSLKERNSAEEKEFRKLEKDPALEKVVNKRKLS